MHDFTNASTIYRKKEILLMHTLIHTPIINLAFGTAGSHNSSATVCVGGVAAALNQCKIISLALSVLLWHHPHTSSLTTNPANHARSWRLSDPSHPGHTSKMFYGFLKFLYKPKFYTGGVWRAIQPHCRHDSSDSWHVYTTLSHIPVINCTPSIRSALRASNGFAINNKKARNLL